MVKDAFAHVETWIFDLDNTLYPRVDAMWDAVDQRMTGWIARALGLPRAEARALQKRYLEEHGMTARGLMLHHDLDPVAFLIDSHDVDLSAIPANPALGRALKALPGRRVIHTNNHARNAGTMLAHLHIADAFDAVYDISATGMVAKPARGAFQAVLDAEGADPARAAFFEDSARNLVVPHAMGMVTVWTPTDCEWATAGAEDGHIQHVAPDLTAFLEALA